MTARYAWIALGALLGLWSATARSSGTEQGAPAPAGEARQAAASETGADVDHEEVRRLREAGEVVALEALIEKSRLLQPGRLLEAELERHEGRYVYELEYVDDAGTVWEFRYDAHTGELLGREHKD